MKKTQEEAYNPNRDSSSRSGSALNCSNSQSTMGMSLEAPAQLGSSLFVDLNLWTNRKKLTKPFLVQKVVPRGTLAEEKRTSSWWRRGVPMAPAKLLRIEAVGLSMAWSLGLERGAYPTRIFGCG